MFDFWWCPVLSHGKSSGLAGASLPASYLVELSGHSECQSLRDLRVFKYKFDGPFQGWSGPWGPWASRLGVFFSVKVFRGEKISGWYLHESMRIFLGCPVASVRCFCRQSGRRMAYNNMKQGVLKGFYEVDVCLFWKLGWKSPKNDTVPTDSWLMNKTAQLCSPGCSVWTPKK